MAKKIKKILLKDHYIHQFFESRTHTYQTTEYSVVNMGMYGCLPTTYVKTHRETTRGKCIDSGENVTHYNPPDISDLTSLIEQLRGAIEKKSNELTKELLTNEFIFSKEGTPFEESNIHTDHDTELQGHYYTYQNFCVRPAIEELLLKQPLAFKKLIEEKQTPLNRAQYIKNLSLIMLTDPDEKIDFQDFDLTDASFKRAVLGKSNLKNATTVNVDFSECDLSQTNVTQEQLDASASYHRAKVPNTCWTYWDSNVKNELLVRFKKMKDYAEKNFQKEDPRFQKVMQLYNTYQPILSRPTNVNSKEKAALLNDLTSKETQKILNEQSGLSYLLAEIVSFVLLLGIGYLIMAAIKKRETGYFGLFAEPKTGKITRELQAIVTPTTPLKKLISSN